MKSLISIFSLLACAALAASQDIGSNIKITYTTKAVPLSSAFTDLSKQAKVHLYPSDELANEIIVLRMNDVPAQDFLDRLASAFCAKWTKKSDGLELERTADQDDQLRKESLDAKAKQFKDAIALTIKTYQPDQPLSQDRIDSEAAKIMSVGQNITSNAAVEMEHMANFLPDQRAVWRIMAKIDPNEIAAMGDDSKIVFSNKPTKMEHEVNGDFSDIFAGLQSEHNALAASIRKIGVEPGMQWPYVLSDIAAKDIEQPERFVIVISRAGLNEGIETNAVFLDGENHPIVAIQGANSYLQMNQAIEEQTQLARTNQKESEIVLSPLGESFLTHGKRGASMDELRQTLIHPETTDPLALLVSEAFLDIAKQRNENLLLYPDDELAARFWFAAPGNTLKPSTVLSSAEKATAFSSSLIDEKDGWLTVVPSDRLDALQKRMDRSALGEYLRTCAQDGYETTDAMAKMAKSVQGFGWPILAVALPQFITGHTPKTINADVALLKFYDSLDDNQRRTLQQSEALRAGDLRPDQIPLMSRCIYQGNAQGGNGRTLAEAVLNEEAAEIIPDGLPTNISLNLTEGKSDTYFVRLKNSGEEEAIGLLNLAAWIREGSNPSEGDAPNIESITPGQELQLGFLFNLTNSIYVEWDLTEQRKLAGGPWTVDNLPADLKASLDKAMQRIVSPGANGAQSGGAPPGGN